MSDTQHTTLVIMAAGIGSRFGLGIKQLQTISPNGHIIIDYTIHDAIEAGFDRIIVIIRKDIKDEFMEVIGNRIEEVCAKHGVELLYAYQELQNLPEGYSCPEDRKKPWGTGHAVLACDGMIQEPFAVLNADDYYGKSAFRLIYDFLQDYDPQKPDAFAMAGFVLKNTLSDNGEVTRGICQADENGYLTDVVETRHIVKTENGAEAEGVQLDMDSLASMNFWGLTPEYMDMLKDGFVEFLKQNEDMTKGEFLIPEHIGELVRNGEVSVRVLRTEDRWFGMTYKEDVETVREEFQKLFDQGVYTEDLFSDL